MATTDSITFPVKGQAYRLYGVIRSSATANPITGGLTTPTVTGSLDGAAFASTGLTVTEIGTTGYFYVEIDATRMNVNAIIIEVTAANANAIKFSRVINPADLSESTTRATAQTVVKIEQIWRQGWGFEFNRTVIDRATGIYSNYNDADDTALYTGTCTDTGAQGIGTRAKLT